MKRNTISNLTPHRLVTLVAASTLVILALPYIANIRTAHAASSISDSVNLSIPTHCSFRTIGTAVSDNLTYSAQGINGQEVAFANNNDRHDFNVLCNHKTGYTVKAYATDLIYEESSIPFVNFTNYSTSGPSNWTAKITNGNSDATFSTDKNNPGTILSIDSYSADTGESFTVDYKAYIGDALPAGTYTGTATYTIATNPLPIPAPNVATVTYMQDVTPQMCKDTPLYSESGTTYHLTDARTDASYLVRKLDDGNCWMTQNLWLKADTNYIGSKGTSFNTNGSSASGWIWDGASDTQFYEGTHTDNAVDGNSNTGSFFTWKKATADTGGAYGTEKAATDDVCPTNWTLPTGGDSGNFKALYATAYNGDFSNFNAVWNSSLIGDCFENSCTDNQDSLAAWWAFTQYGSTSGLYMRMDDSSFFPTSSNYKGYGFSVRCMLSGN